MVCPIAIGKAFGLAAATRKYEALNCNRYQRLRLFIRLTKSRSWTAPVSKGSTLAPLLRAHACVVRAGKSAVRGLGGFLLNIFRMSGT